MRAAGIYSRAYKESRDHSVYVLLSDTGTLFTRMIKGFTSAPYNHASIGFDAGLNELYSFGRKRAGNPFHAGFVREDVYEGTFARFPRTRCALLRLQTSPEQRADLQSVIAEFQRRGDSYWYNLPGLLGVLLNRPIEPDHAYFCSQFVAETLRRGGIALWDRSSALVTPEDFRQAPQLEIVYEGFLYDYPLLDGARLRQANTYQSRTAARYVN